jgi:hypothetical protein
MDGMRLPDVTDTFSVEREAVQQVLQSPLFRRAPNLSRILEYICRQYFEGTADHIKEYNIAVEALGRSTAFDPQIDAIVRVDLHLLRKRLNAYYARAGKRDGLRIVLRAGSYAPEFVSAKGLDSSDTGLCDGKVRPTPQAVSLSGASLPRVTKKLPRPLHFMQFAKLSEQPDAGGVAWGIWIACAGCGLLGLLAGVLATLSWTMHLKPEIIFNNDLPGPAKTVSATLLQNLGLGSAPDSLLDGIRIRCGSSSDFVDSAGLHWQGDRYFKGGSAFERPVTAIQRSTDPALYSSGRQGVFQYDIPVSPGAYEVHLLFAETQPGIEDAMRQVSYTVGLGQADTIDIVSDAGGEYAATQRVYTGVHPGQNGKIHLNFWSLNSLLNAIEILPEKYGKPQPVRISTQHTLYSDISGGHWLPDRYYRGGRNVDQEFARNQPTAPLFTRERYGTFDYAIPVAKGYKYQITLFMAEHYWGSQNSGLGGAGSRIFTVRCNEMNLLTNFDLFAAQKGSGTIAVRFRDLEPDQTGQLRLSFIPVVNYPLVNAIDVEAE